MFEEKQTVESTPLLSCRFPRSTTPPVERRSGSWCGTAIVRRILAALVVVTAVCSTGLAQGDYYVNAETGSDSGSGTQAAPWRTVTYSLTQIPPDSDSTLKLMGTTSVNYSFTNGEVFPWEVKGDVSLVRDPNAPPSTNVIVDVQGNGFDIVTYAASFGVDNSRIEGLTMTNGASAITWDLPEVFHLLILDCDFLELDYGLDASPAGPTSVFSPTIQGCHFKDTKNCIRIVASSGAYVVPEIRDNTTAWENSSKLQFLYVDLSSVTADINVDNNIVNSVNAEAMYLTGIPVTAKAAFTNNTVNSPKSGSDGLEVDGYVGVVEITDNTFYSLQETTLTIINCNPWSSDSVISRNTCDSLRGTGLMIYATSDVTVDNNFCFGGNLGLRATWSPGIVVDGNMLTCNSGGRGLYMDQENDGARVTNNTIGDDHNPMQRGMELIGENILVRENTIRNSEQYGIYVHAGTTGTEIIDNEIYGHAWAGIYVNSPDITVAKNRVFSNAWTGITDAVCEGNLYTSNWITNNGSNGLELLATSATNFPYVVHNTCADNQGYGFHTDLPTALSPYVANNIFYFNHVDADISGLEDGEYVHNCIGVGGNLLHGNINDDPLFVSPGPPDNDYHLQPTSPCIDSGINQGAMWATDIDGDPRTLDGNWDGQPVTDMGGDEYTDLADGGSLWVTGTFQPGEEITVTITIENLALVGYDYAVYAAIDEIEMPLATQPGYSYPIYGTVLLDPTKLAPGNPILTGQIQGETTTATMTIPDGIDPYHVVMQALVTNPVAGQLTCAATFSIVLP